MARATVPSKVKSAAPEQVKAVAPEKEKSDKKRPGKKDVAPKMAAAPKKQAAAKKPAVAKQQAAAKMPATKKAATKKAADLKQAQLPKNVPTPKKSGHPKAAARVVAVKLAPRRPATRLAVPTPARRGRTPMVARKPPARRLGGAAASRTFTVSHLNEADFKVDGLRAYALYRDLGMAAATAGLCQAHVIRFVPPCSDEVRKPHVHSAELQLVYVLKGWIKNEFEGHGEQMMSAGSCWLQPSGVQHTVLDYSADCEVLEIIVPADFKTGDA